MSSTKPPREGLAPDLPSDVRALSPRPNLEHERKQAKQLLDQLRPAIGKRSRDCASTNTTRQAVFNWPPHISARELAEQNALNPLAS